MRRLLGFGVTTAALAATLGSGCGSASNPDFVDIRLFPSAYAQALCGSLRHCCDENQVTFVDSECTAGWKSVVDKLIADPVLGGNYDPRIATSCIDQVRAAAPATCDPEPGSISAARDTCQRVFLGRKPVGELCSSSLECAPVPDQIVGCEGLPIPDPNAGLLPLSTMTPESPSTLGTRSVIAPQALPTARRCVALPPPSPGSSCATLALKTLCEKESSQYCDATDGICKARGDSGQPCSAGGCVVGFYCSNGFCEPGSESGGACTDSAACNTFLRCNLGTGRCEDRLRPADTCDTDADCSIGICDLSTKRCLRNAIATSESCRGTDPVTVPR